MTPTLPVAMASGLGITAADGGSGNLTLSPTTSFAVPFDARRLVNTYHLPLEITEIRFVARGSPEDRVNVLAYGNHLGLLLAAKITAGADRITGDDPVPLAAFGPPLQAPEYDDVGLTNGEREITTNPVTGEGTDYRDAFHFRWVLPRPMLLPAGQAIMASLSPTVHGISYPFSPLSVNVWIAVVGRYAQNVMPAKRAVPYISAYQFQRLADGTLERQHPQRVFASPFNDRALNVQRFIGRLLGADTGNANIVYDASHGSIGNAVSDAATPTGAPTIRAMAPKGYWAPQDPIPFDRLFDVQRRVWDCPHVLEGVDDLWKFTVDSYPATNPDLLLPMIAMVGWREEALP